MKIIQEISIEKDVQTTKVTVFSPSESLLSKLKTKYEKYLLPRIGKSNSYSFVFQKPIKISKLKFEAKTKAEKKFFDSLQKFFQAEKLKYQSSQEIQILETILNSFLKNGNTPKTWTNLKKYLLSELQK